MSVPDFPHGDLLTAIDNDQVLINKWTVRKGNRAQISVLTSVCAAQIVKDGTLQREPTLALRKANIYHTSACFFFSKVMTLILLLFYDSINSQNLNCYDELQFQCICLYALYNMSYM